MPRSLFLLLFSLVMVACTHADPAPTSPPAATPVTGTAVAEGPWLQEARVPVSSSDPAVGPREADVTLVEFTDLECPYCARAHGYLADVKAHFGSRLRIVWKDYPLPAEMHPYALSAAITARVAFLAAGNDAFWRLATHLFVHQRTYSEEFLAGALTNAGVSADAIQRFGEQAKTYVHASLDLGDKLGVDGTPTFFVDGERIEFTNDGTPAEQLSKKVDAHLQMAEKMKRAGIAPAALYSAMSAYYEKIAPPVPKAINPEDVDDFVVWKAPVGKSPVRGTQSALVTIVEFADFECPFCRRADATIESLRQTYGDKIRFVWKNYPLSFHPHARSAANLALEVRAAKGDAAFWRVHDDLIKATSLEDDSLADIGKKAGLTDRQIASAKSANAYQGVIDDDYELAEDVGVRGAPHFLINGRKLVGAQPIDKFTHIIDQELKKVQDMGGTRTADNLYDLIIKDGKGGPIDIAVPPGAPFKGPANAKVVMQIWSDFQCPFCKRFEIADPNADDTGGLQVLDQYKNSVKYVWRNLPLPMHPHARAAATFALEAQAEKGNAMFWKVHDELYRAADLTETTLQSIAQKLGIDWLKVQAAISNDKFHDVLAADEKAAHDADIGGTPSYVIAGRVHRGFVSGSELQKQIEQAIAKAK
jgi:protein-disulfide isomerase